MYNVKLPALIDHINTSMASWHCRTVDITLSFLLNYAPVCQARGLGGSCLESVDFTCSWCVCFNGRGERHKLSPIMGSSCWGDVSETSLLTQMLQHLTETVHLITLVIEGHVRFSP